MPGTRNVQRGLGAVVIITGVAGVAGVALGLSPAVRAQSGPAVSSRPAPAAPAAEPGLVAAVRSGDGPRWRRLIAGPDGRKVVSEAGADGMTALHWAVLRDDGAATTALLRAGARATVATRYGVTPLALACVNGNAAIIGQLLEAGADPNAPGAQGETPLMTAARTGAVSAIDTLVGAGAAVNARETWKGQTALMWAVAEKHADAARALVARGADIEARSTAGLTPLLYAVRAGDAASVDLLLASGARIDGPAPDGTSPLVLAILNAHYELAARLLEKGADPNVPDPRGSALHALAFMRRPGTPIGPPPVETGTLDTLALARLLLERGATPNARIAWKDAEFTGQGNARLPPDIEIGRTSLSLVGATPFFLAAKHADVALMQLLLAHGADPHLPTVQNVTPLIAAAGLGFWEGESPGTEREALEAVTLLLERGADVNAVADAKGVRLGDMRWDRSTALHGAAIRGANSIVELLVARGAKLDVVNAVGWTPLNVTEGQYIASTYKRQPHTEQLLRKLMGR